MTEGAGTDPTKLSANTKRKVALHKAYVKSAGNDVPKNVALLQTNPGGATKDKKLGSKAQLEMRFGPMKPTKKPAKGPTANDAGQMNSSSSGSAMGPAYMR